MRVIVRPGTKPTSWGLTGPPPAHWGAPLRASRSRGSRGSWWGGWAGHITPMHCPTPSQGGKECPPSSPLIPHSHPMCPILTLCPSRWWQVSRALTVRSTSMSVTLTHVTTGPARTASPPSPASASPATQATAATSTSTSARASPAKMGGPARTGTTPTTASASKGPRVRRRDPPGALCGLAVPHSTPVPSPSSGGLALGHRQQPPWCRGWPGGTLSEGQFSRFGEPHPSREPGSRLRWRHFVVEQRSVLMSFVLPPQGVWAPPNGTALLPRAQLRDQPGRLCQQPLRLWQVH